VSSALSDPPALLGPTPPPLSPPRGGRHVTKNPTASPPARCRGGCHRRGRRSAGRLRPAGLRRDGRRQRPSLTSVIDNLRNWLVGILAAVATLFLTIGGLRYLTAGGDPGQVEKAKTALKSAAIGYALAALAPLLVSILVSLFP
jgi:hypothetical protein